MQQAEVIKGQLEKSVLKEQFMIGRHLDSGSNGKVYKVIDSKQPKANLVIKISEDVKGLSQEVNTMIKISKGLCVSEPGDSIPRVVDYGILSLEQKGGQETLMAYMIIPRYGINLDDYFLKMKYIWSKNTILDLALGVLDALEQIHSAGHVYNDLKLDNIMVGYKSKLPKQETPGRSAFQNCSIHLVDFGYSSAYMRREKHIEEGELNSFKGNMMFSSLNQLNFKTPSRRDDIISLCYLLSFVLNKGQISGMDFDSDMAPAQAFKYVKSVKSKLTLGDLCSNNAECLT
jgi:serine/threonine protein kinase